MTKTKKTKYLMIQGTGSHVGKSVIVAALCRIFANKGFRVAPFKAQNMALNSFVTADGCEVGRSTALQALGAHADLSVEMNPILLKPKAEKEAQLILNGKPYADVSAFNQFHRNQSLRSIKWEAIQSSLLTLSQDYELIVIEGAGSPAEVNLREFDLVNMEVALHTGAPVLLVTDIDRGGSLAALVGTLELLSKEERTHVKGFIFNKFRGDQRLFDPAIEFLQNKTSRPTLGVIPHNPNLSLMEEDALAQQRVFNGEPQIEIAIVEHRMLSNFTDFDPLMLEPNVEIRFVRSPAQLGQPDALILPGTKNTVKDLQQLYASGMAHHIQTLAKKGDPILGICGGYQMMGKMLIDPNHIESDQGDLGGLGLLDMVTTFRPGKITRQVTRQVHAHPPFFPDADATVTGYEIHCGLSRSIHSNHNSIFKNQATEALHEEGVHDPGLMDQSGLLFGTSLHGIFENDLFRRNFVNVLRKRKGLSPISSPLLHFHQIEDEQIDSWAAFVSEALDFPLLEKIVDKQI